MWLGRERGGNQAVYQDVYQKRNPVGLALQGLRGFLFFEICLIFASMSTIRLPKAKLKSPESLAAQGVLGFSFTLYKGR